jgi:hypothetical protein
MSSTPEEDPSNSLGSSPAGPPFKRGRKESFLRWWAIIPAALYIGLVILFCRPAANEPAAADEMRLSGYILGAAFIGLVISLVFAWIIYVVTGKSRLWSTVTFCLGVAFFSLVFLGSGASPQDEHANPRGQPQPLVQPARQN